MGIFNRKPRRGQRVVPQRNARGSPKLVFRGRAEGVEAGHDPRRAQPWWMIAKEAEKFTHHYIDKNGFGGARIDEIQRLLLELDIRKAKPEEGDVSFEKAQMILEVKKHQAEIEDVLREIQSKERRLHQGTVRVSNVKPGFDSRRKGPSALLPGKLVFGEKTTHESIRKPVNPPKTYNIFTRIPLIGEPVGGRIDQFLSSTLNFFTGPFRGRGETIEENIRQKLPELRKELDLKIAEYQGLAQEISGEDIKALEVCIQKYVYRRAAA